MDRELKSILCIDDDPDILQIVELTLKALGGFEVSTHPGGAEAIAAAASCRPDLILLDVMMPELDGPAVLELLHSEAATQSIPVAFMTARVEAADVEEYLASGCAGVIAKPFNPATLAGEVRALWKDIGNANC
jgi:two-component system, OmpR family, response regulator